MADSEWRMADEDEVVLPVTIAVLKNWMGEPPEMCSACEGGRHWDCGMQTWCTCECSGPDGDYSDDPFWSES